MAAADAANTRKFTGVASRSYLDNNIHVCKLGALNMT